jgi:hypothetical protein
MILPADDFALSSSGKMRETRMNKQDILQIVDRLPDPFDPEQLMHELYPNVADSP